MNKGIGDSLLDHHIAGPSAWSTALRLALLAITILALVMPFGVQQAFASGAGAPASAPQQAEDGEDDAENGGDGETDGENGQDGDGGEGGEDGDESADGEDAGTASAEESDNERFYIIFGALAFFGMVFAGIALAVFGYVGTGR